MKKYTFFFLIWASWIQAQTFTNYTTVDGLANASINAIAIDTENRIWLGTQGGISVFDGSIFTNYTTANGLIDDAVTAIASDSQGNIWAGTDFGVSRFDGTSWTNYTDNNGLADNRIKYIQDDGNGNVWFGNNDGVSVFDGSDWVSYTTSDGLPFGGVNCIEPVGDGVIWLGTALGGVRIYTNNEFIAITEEEGLLNDKVRSIATDNQGNKWVGTSDGISLFDANNDWVANHEIIFELPPPDELNPVEDVQIDQNGCIWAGVYVDYLVTEGGVTYYNGDTWIDLDVTDGLAGPVVRRLAIDADNNIWIATSVGLSKVSDVNCQFITSTKNVLAASDFAISPNPSQDFISVSTETTNSFDIVLYNALGEVVVVQQNITHQTQLNIQSLSEGTYFVHIRTKDGGILNKKVVKF